MRVSRPKGFTPLDWWHFFRPPVIGAALLSSYVAVRILLLATSGRHLRDRQEADSAFLFAAASGAVCGLVYSLLGRRLRERGALGNYSAGIITVCPYFVFLVFYGPDASTRAGWRDPFGWGLVAFLSTLMGVFLGREFHEKDNLFKPDA